MEVIGVFMSNITVITLNKFGKRTRGFRVHVFLVYTYVRYTVLFAPACKVWVLGKRFTKAITKVQKAARQKPNSKR